MVPVVVQCGGGTGVMGGGGYPGNGYGHVVVQGGYCDHPPGTVSGSLLYRHHCNYCTGTTVTTVPAPLYHRVTVPAPLYRRVTVPASL